MAKRQRRYNAAEVAAKAASLAGTRVSLVLKGGQVYEGMLLAVKEDHLLLKNGLQQNQHFPLASIEEVIVETHT